MLRYFATNRGMDTLARSLDREARLKLSTGGYFFLDMCRYMSFYFAEVDEEAVPPAVLELKSAETVFGPDFIGSDKVGTVVICVHGFNVELREASTWFRILTDTMRHDPGLANSFILDPDDEADRGLMQAAAPDSLHAFIGFSWPSAGNTVNYYGDQGRAEKSSAPLANLVVRCLLAGKRVKLICHSMGNYVACNMLAGLVTETIFVKKLLDEQEEKKERVDDILARLKRAKAVEGRIPGEVNRQDYLIDTFVMIAPDVERRHVTKVWEDTRGTVRTMTKADAKPDSLAETYVGPYYPGIQHLCGRVVNVYSRFDGALNISNIAQGTKDKGLALGDTASRLTLGLLDFLERNPDQRWEMRLGSVPHPFNAPPNFVSVNATEVAGRPINHSDHIDCPPLVQRIARELGL